MGCKISCADLYSVHSLFMTLYLVPLAETRPEVIKKIMLNSAEQEIYPAHKC